MFGIIVDDLLPSQKNIHMIGIANTTKAHLFTKCLTRACKDIDTILMDISEIWDYHGLLIATSLDTYRFMSRSVNAAEKIFFVYDPNQLKVEDHEEIADIDIPLYARSKSHATKVFQITGKKAEVMNFGDIVSKWSDK
jgi:hypothetical protein